MSIKSAQKNWNLITKPRGSKADLARYLGITKGAVNQWKVVPSERVPAVARYFNVPYEYLRPDL